MVSLHQGVHERDDGGEGGFLDVVERVGGGDGEHGGDVLQEGREVSRVAGFARRERERLDEREADLLARLEGVHRAAAAALAAASRGGPGSGSGPDARGDRGCEMLQRRRAVVESLHEREDELRARLAHLLHRIVHAAQDRGEERGDEEGEERGGGRLGGIAEESEGWEGGGGGRGEGGAGERDGPGGRPANDRGGARTMMIGRRNGGTSRDDRSAGPGSFARPGAPSHLFRSVWNARLRVERSASVMLFTSRWTLARKSSRAASVMATARPDLEPSAEGEQRATAR